MSVITTIEKITLDRLKKEVDKKSDSVSIMEYLNLLARDDTDIENNKKLKKLAVLVVKRLPWYDSEWTLYFKDQSFLIPHYEKQ